MKKLIYFLPTLLLLLMTFPVWSQGDAGYSDLGATMRSNGRIYVVVAVMLTILFGLIFYVVRLDRKISKLEKEKN